MNGGDLWDDFCVDFALEVICPCNSRPDKYGEATFPLFRLAASYPRGLQELYNFIENFNFCLHENNEMHSKIIISTKTHKQKLLIYIYNSMLKNGPSNVICLRRTAYHLVNFCP